MADYRIELTVPADRDLGALPGNVLRRVDARILALAERPRPLGCRRLQGRKDFWRVRVGDYRILYAIDDQEHIVTVARVRHRREVYRGL